MLIGAHQSTAGGLERAFARAREDGCEAMQIFTKAPQTWREPDLSPAQIEAFRRARQESGVRVVVSHGAYLVNPCAPNEEVLAKSQAALIAEARRCDQLGVEALVLHPGSPGQLGRDRGVELAARTVGKALEASERVRILVENTAGQGQSIGAALEDLRDIIQLAGASTRLGVCFDTCHAFAAGHDLRTPDQATEVLGRLDLLVGAARLGALHLNDAKKELGSRVDRHEPLGAGRLGLALFGHLVNAPRLATVPGILETPLGEGETYAREIGLLKSLRT